MALIIIGSTPCVICGKILKENDHIRAFMAFLEYPDDPLSLFSDGGVHAECLASHPLRQVLETRMEQLDLRTGPAGRKCFICKNNIQDPNDFLNMGFFTDDRNHPLNILNYENLHLSCVPHWSGLTSFLAELEEIDKGDNWKGKPLQPLIEQLTKAHKEL